MSQNDLIGTAIVLVAIAVLLLIDRKTLRGKHES